MEATTAEIPLIEFDKTRALRYHPKGLRLALLIPHGATYFVGWSDDPQAFTGPHYMMLVVSEIRPGHFEVKGTPYGCALREFASTYAGYGGFYNIYQKTTTVLAYQPGHAFRYLTLSKGGEANYAEGTETHWIVQNEESGDTYPVPDETFRESYDAGPERTDQPRAPAPCSDVPDHGERIHTVRSIPAD